MFKVGDRVLIKYDSQYYGSHPDTNPADIVGMIIQAWDGSTNPESYHIRVHWGIDLGWFIARHTNSYREKDLILVKEIKIAYPDE